jgi:pimeloyl-ACP methyl ester carboxylesterase
MLKTGKRPLAIGHVKSSGTTTSFVQMLERAAINFCTSRDGTRLAVASVGNGPPLVVITLHEGGDKLDAPTFASSHLEHALSAHVRHVRYDARGCGMSDREVRRLDFAAFEEDLDAVICALGTDSAMLFGVSHGGSLAVRYAASHPARPSCSFP